MSLFNSFSGSANQRFAKTRLLIWEVLWILLDPSRYIRKVKKSGHRLEALVSKIITRSPLERCFLYPGKNCYSPLMGAQDGPIDGTSMAHRRAMVKRSADHRWVIDGNAMVHRWPMDGLSWDPNWPLEVVRKFSVPEPVDCNQFV